MQHFAPVTRKFCGNHVVLEAPMFQFRHSSNLRLVSCCLLVLSAYLTTPGLYAADEDIDIPYTDTYGYVYDPATGTYIKQDPVSTTEPAVTPVTTDTTELTGTSVNADTVTPETVVPSATTMPSSTGLALPLLLVLSIAALFTWLFRMRQANKPERKQP
jgi:hypothetical protein